MQTKYVKSPLNYTGGKHSILEHIIPLFPKKINNFVDLFAGGFNVGINVNAKNIFANDQITYLTEMFAYFKDMEITDLLKKIDVIIDEYSLNQINSDGYNKLREDYNKNQNPLSLFVLTCFSFNHQIRFNNSMKFNTPFGKNRSSYNESIKKNVIRFCYKLKDSNVVFSNKDFRKFDFSVLSEGDLVYCDPPYLISSGSYNDGKRGFNDWRQEEDDALLEILDMLNERRVYFFLSNVFYHKGLANEKLIQWARKYNVCYIDKDYSNCNYQIKNRNFETVEVLINNLDQSINLEDLG